MDIPQNYHAFILLDSLQGIKSPLNKPTEQMGGEKWQKLPLALNSPSSLSAKGIMSDV